MKHCPFMTIARSVAADQVVSHGACQGADCALWNTREEECSVQAISGAIDRLTAGIFVAGKSLADIDHSLSHR